MAYSPDGKTIASGSEDKTIKLWDPTTGRERCTLVGHTGRVLALAFSPDGSSWPRETQGARSACGALRAAKALGPFRSTRP